MGCAARLKTGFEVGITTVDVAVDIVSLSCSSLITPCRELVACVVTAVITEVKASLALNAGFLLE